MSQLDIPERKSSLKKNERILNDIIFTRCSSLSPSSNNDEAGQSDEDLEKRLKKKVSYKDEIEKNSLCSFYDEIGMADDPALTVSDCSQKNDNKRNFPKRWVSVDSSLMFKTESTTQDKITDRSSLALDDEILEDKNKAITGDYMELNVHKEECCFGDFWYWIAHVWKKRQISSRKSSESSSSSTRSSMREEPQYINDAAVVVGNKKKIKRDLFLFRGKFSRDLYHIIQDHLKKKCSFSSNYDYDSVTRIHTRKLSEQVLFNDHIEVRGNQEILFIHMITTFSIEYDFKDMLRHSRVVPKYVFREEVLLQEKYEFVYAHVTNFMNACQFISEKKCGSSFSTKSIQVREAKIQQRQSCCICQPKTRTTQFAINHPQIVDSDFDNVLTYLDSWLNLSIKGMFQR